jgi:GH25 family lysozyme M1 (1,4-beta-N-acetylmuramidase)
LRNESAIGGHISYHRSDSVAAPWCSGITATESETSVNGVPGIDVSRWQGEIDWGRVAAAGYRFAVIRATVGNYYTDPRFYINWEGAGDAKLLLAAYHVLAPERPADSQIECLFDVLGARSPDFPVVFDVELRREVSPERITACIIASADLVERKDGRRPIIYTARWFWDNNVLRSPDWSTYDLWVAHYGVESPALPADWDEWKLWQHSDRGRVPGIHAATDLNWFNGSYEDLLAYVDAEKVGEQRPQGGLQARVTAEKLSMRSGPGMNYGYVGDLQEGDVVNVVSLAGEDIWIQVEPGKWAPLTSRGKRFMELE